MSSSPAATGTATVGRIVGGLVLVHVAGGLILPYVLLKKVVPSPDLLESAARHPGHLRATALLFLAAGIVALAISVAAYPVLRQASHRLALFTLALGIVNLAMQMVEGGAILSLLSFGQQYTASGGADGAMLQVVAAAALTARRWAHFTQLLTVVSWIFVLYAALWRAGLIPRALAAAGLLTSTLQLIGVPLRALLGYPLVMELAIPLGPVYAALGLWLIVKGFAERREIAPAPALP